MESWIQRAFAQHLSNENPSMEDVQQHGVLLVTALASLFMSLALVLPLMFMQDDQFPRYLAFTLYLGMLSLSILALVRFRRMRAARWTAVAGFWSLATFAIATSGGIYSSVYMLYMVLIILAGLTFGLWGGLYMTLLNVGATFSFLYLGHLDLLPAGRPTSDTIQVISILYQVGSVLALIGVAVMVFRQTLEKVRKEVEERQRTERELREEQTLTMGLFNSLPGLAILVDSEGRLVRWNREVERVGGYGSEDLNLKPARDLVDTADQAALEQLFAETLDKGHALGELGYRTRDGRRVPIRVVCNRCELDGNAYIVSAGLDMTEHRALEQQFLQMQKMEAVGRLAGGVAHDFNNILTVINGYAEILLAKHPLEEDPQRQELELIHQSGMRAGALTRQLLAFSRQQMMNPREVRLNDLVLDLDKMLRRLIGEDVQLTLELDPGLGVVQADPSQLEQVLLNLAVNARDAMPNGGRLSIATSSILLDESTVGMGDELQPGPHVVLTVADSGIGMSEEVKAKIFEPFFTTKALGQGTGLGLSTVIGIVRQSGGQIQVFSEPGAGATFKIYLPEGHVSGVGSGPVAEDAVRGGLETILVAEDDAVVRNLVKRILKTAGYTVISAESGPDALEAFRFHSGRVDPLLTDVIMPGGMTGADLALDIMAFRPSMKVIYMSGYSHTIFTDAVFSNMQVELLPKPFTANQLLRAVRQMLDDDGLLARPRQPSLAE